MDQKVRKTREHPASVGASKSSEIAVATGGQEGRLRRWARPKAAAKHLGISLSTFWAWSLQPGFPPLRRLGGRVTLADLNELDQFVSGGA